MVEVRLTKEEYEKLIDERSTLNKIKRLLAKDESDFSAFTKLDIVKMLVEVDEKEESEDDF